MKKIVSAVAGAAALCSTGCIKNENTTTVNADGSARFSTVMELNLAPLLGMMGGGKTAPGANPLGDPREMLVQMMRAMGPTVDAWTEAKTEVTKLGATKITLAGLTKDFTAGGDLKKIIASSGSSAAAELKDFPDVKMINSTKDASGNWVISTAGLDEMMTIFTAIQKKAAEEGKFEKNSIQVTEEELAAKLDEFRGQYAQLKPMVAMFVKDVSLKSEMTVAGDILECAVFEKTSPNTVSFSFTGEQIIGMVDAVVADKALPKKIMKLVDAFNEGPESDKPAAALREFLEPFVKEVFGGAPAPKVVIKPSAKPAFDYDAAVKQAQSAMSAELKKLVEESSKPPVAKEKKKAA